MSSNNKEMSLIGIEGNDAAEDEDLADNMEYPREGIDYSTEVVEHLGVITETINILGADALILLPKMTIDVIKRLKKLTENNHAWEDPLNALNDRQTMWSRLVEARTKKLPRKLRGTVDQYVRLIEKLAAIIIEQSGVLQNTSREDTRFVRVHSFLKRSLEVDSNVEDFNAELATVMDEIQAVLVGESGTEREKDQHTPFQAQGGPETLSEDDDSAGWETDSDGGAGKRTAIPPLLPAPASLSSPNDSLCDVCKALELSPQRFVVLPSDGEFQSMPDNPNISLGLVEDIRKKTHCPFCRLVIVALGGPEIPSFEDGEPVTVVMSWSTNGRLPDINQPWNHTPEIRLLRPYAQKQDGGYVRSERLNLFPEITLLANDSPTSSYAFFVRPVREDQIDFGVVRNWISMCEDWHGEACRKSRMVDEEIKNITDEIPSFRLIDVVDNCLVQGVGNSRYAALSYVWGRVDSLRTLKENVKALEQPGALMLPEYHTKIPMTIRDAMQAVRELGLRYLWVDSLCIIQDDDSRTKEDNILKMDLVYGAAFLTIMAATGADANAGLPGVRPGTRGQRQPIEEIMPGFRLAFKPLYQNHIKDSAYFTRAWTFQEMLFSKRSLKFIGGQVVFGCQKADQWREDVVFEDETIISGEHSIGDRETGDIGEFEGLIQSYSGLSLTFQSDIYNAFSGLARFIKAELKANLCHGIPGAYFDWFLLWEPLKPQTRRPHAPSWSWSGWIGASWPRIWDWYTRSVSKIQKAQRKRTWIIWYHRIAHDSTECALVWKPKKHSSSNPRNFYGGPISRDRFSLDCTVTAPTPRKLVGAPAYYKDILSPIPGSGFLQFWTVSVTFRLDTPTSKADTRGPEKKLFRLGIFGRDGYEVGIVSVNKTWWNDGIPRTQEFILLCEGRDVRAEGGREDEEDGWKYRVMLIEWHGEWAERVAVGSIEKQYLNQALGAGPTWKEIVLG